MTASELKPIIDVAIAGGGQAGLALAVALRQAAPDLTVTVIDPAGRTQREGRASTIAAGGRRLLEHLGVWADIAPDAQAVTSMIITDSRTRDVARPVFLTFPTETTDGEASAHVVADSVVTDALRAAADRDGVVLMDGTVTGFDTGPGAVALRLSTGNTRKARLLVAADGLRSRLRALAGIATVGWSYGQSGIVVTVAHERPHNGRAEEHFLPGGPFAILPLKGNRASLVWTEPTEVTERLVAADGVTFKIELERRFGHHLGALDVISKPAAFPLGLMMARAFVARRFALVGDAAHGIHPIAGQGLNLGYRDVAALAETIVEAHRLGLDIGSLSVLERYQQWRRADTVEMGAVTDVLNRLFSNDNALLRVARDVGLGLVDRLPELKGYFIREAAGEIGDLPRLLRGEAI